MIVTTSILKEKYNDYNNPIDKIKRECDKGNLIRINKGIYETDKTCEPYFIANVLLNPSYVSFEFALSMYGLIPERVTVITSASFQQRKNKSYTNYFGRFEYSDIPARVYPYEVSYYESRGYFVKIASKEKALCDSLYKWRVVHSITDLKQMLFEDKRIDINEFEQCDFEKIISLAKLYNSTNLNLLIKLIKKEFIHE